MVIRGQQDCPKFLEISHVARIFRILYPFSDEGIAELAAFFRLLWQMEQAYESRQARRLELLRALREIKRRKVELEKLVLQNQIAQLELL